MKIWPFSRPAPEVRFSRLRRDVSRLDIELVDLREDFEKLMAAVKRIQGKSYRRKRADMAEAVQLEPPEGGEPIQPPAAPNGGDQLHNVPFPTDHKATLRKRHAKIRGR